MEILEVEKAIAQSASGSAFLENAEQLRVAKAWGFSDRQACATYRHRGGNRAQKAPAARHKAGL